MLGFSLEQRQAERAMAKRANRLRSEGLPIRSIAALLGVNPSKAYGLVTWPPFSEEQIAAHLAARAAEREAMKARAQQRRSARREFEARWRAEIERQQAEERHETSAASLVCLIEALIEMRPYVPGAQW